MSTPAYGIGVIYNQFKCRCETEMAHELSKCKHTKLKVGGSLDRFTKFCLGPRVFSYDPAWEPPTGVQFVKRNAELLTIYVKGVGTRISLERYAWEFSVPLYLALHQPGHVIRMYIKQEGAANYTNRSIEHFVTEFTARQWNNVMDTLADKEVYTRIIGPLVDNTCWKKPLEYKWAGPLTADEIRKQRKAQGHKLVHRNTMPPKLPSQRVSDMAGVPLEVMRRSQTAPILTAPIITAPVTTTSQNKTVVTCTWHSATAAPQAEPEMFQMEL